MCMLIFLTKWYYFYFQIVIDLGGTVVASVKQCTHLVTRKVYLQCLSPCTPKTALLNKHWPQMSCTLASNIGPSSSIGDSDGFN